MSAGSALSSSSKGTAPRRIEVVDLGVLDYSVALARQEKEVERVRAGGGERLLLVEHPHVYTIGRGADEKSLLGAPRRLGVPCHRVSRGGDATYHGPGQIVAYPILRLEGRDRDLHGYLRKLEEVLLRVVGAFGVSAVRIAGRTGVWVESATGPRKIASIGVGVRRWTTYHGVALNVAPELSFFRAIHPCGLPDAEVTSLERELEQSVDARIVRRRIERMFGEVFEAEILGHRGAVPRRGRAYAARRSVEQPGVSDRRKPPWLKARAPTGSTYFETRRILSGLGLSTVCEEALCPNIGECWSHSTATFLLLGDSCTRSCGFCAVKHGSPTAVDPDEPRRIGEAVAALGLRHVVITSVDRDDLADGGANHFAETARAISERARDCAVEVLVPDFRGRRASVQTVAEAPIEVLNHNTETVPRLYPGVRPGARFDRSLSLLRWAKKARNDWIVKSGLMVGLGERDDELLETFRAIRDTGCDVLTVGQYLRPTREHLPVDRFVTPEEFSQLGDEARALGFRHVESGPLVRSSYHAWSHVPPGER